MTTSELIFDWNTASPHAPKPSQKIGLHDETLRDGLQSPSVQEPTVEQKLELLHLMEALGLDAMDLGLPGAGGTHAEGVERLAREIADQRMRIAPMCAARTHGKDIEAIIDIVEHTGVPIEVAMFVGSSPIRFYVEDWTLDTLLRQTEASVSLARDHGLAVNFVTEDTTRADPEAVRALYGTAIRCGARAVILADTAGHATPDGTRGLVSFVKSVIAASGEPVRLEWHGHQDRGLGVINSIAALEAGADRVHGCALGVGERVGNTPMDQLLVNLKLMGWIDNDLSKLGEYCTTAARAVGWTIPPNYPVFGRDAFRTATGVHAAAIVKSLKKGDDELADLVYSGVPAGWFGLRQSVEIGPMSGRSNVTYWLESRGLDVTEERVARIYERAKGARTVLTEAEVGELL